MTGATNPVIVDMFCGSGGESQGINWSAERAEALTTDYMRELKKGVAT
jgi:hypothetical protein